MSENKTEREAFEAWFLDYCGTGPEGAVFDQASMGWLKRRDDGHYEETRVRDAWTGWQGRAAKAVIARAAIPQAVSAEPQWLPVSGRMPEKDVEVLVYDSSADHVYVTQWCDWWEAPVSFSSKTICVGEGWETGEYEHVTHWMPLPPAPKEQP